MCISIDLLHIETDGNYLNIEFKDTGRIILVVEPVPVMDTEFRL
jgi:hypothetical protein